MADDHTQRPTRSSQPPLRQSPASQSGNDPLAELARLIGQNDPFAEFGRDGARAAPRAPEPAAYASPAGRELAHDGRVGAPGYEDERYADPPQAAPFPQNNAYPPQGYAEPSYAPGDPYAQGVVPGHAAYDQGPYYPNTAHSGSDDQDYYDDIPPRRRLGILAIAAVFALAVIGTAGAFGYRALFGPARPSGPPPVIKADATPSKIVPEAKEAKNGKLIYDRVGTTSSNGLGEKLVSREEQPVDIKDKPTGVVMPAAANGATTDTMQPMLGSGVIGVEPKKVHTIAIRPDQVATATPESSAPALAPAKPAKPEEPAARAAEPPPHRVAVARVEPVRHATTSAAPLSLSPNAAEPPAHAAPHVTRTAAVAPPTAIEPSRSAPARAAEAGSGYAVQIVSRHSEADAQASFHSLQAKFPQELGGRTAMIRRVDLGTKGVYFRAMVGPLSSEQASQLCSKLKAAGGACLIQKI